MLNLLVPTTKQPSFTFNQTETDHLLAQNQFECYVKDFLFVDEDYRLLSNNGLLTATHTEHAQFGKMPTFLFKDNWSKREFYVEVKFNYNSHLPQNLVQPNIAYNSTYNLDKPVFTIAGYGKLARQPNHIFITNNSFNKTTGIRLQSGKAISSRLLWSI